MTDTLQMSEVAALYVDPRGPYPALLGPQMCCDEKRDARAYAGPWPVVAHPPCGPWGKLAFCSKEGHEVKALGPVAVEQVRSFGGVLEHPVGSGLLAHCGIPRPGELPDAFGGVTIEVEQVRWGHVARKRNPAKRQGCAVPEGIKVCSAQQRRRTPEAFARWLIGLAQKARLA